VEEIRDCVMEHLTVLQEGCEMTITGGYVIQPHLCVHTLVRIWSSCVCGLTPTLTQQLSPR
jgi:hypothetical protein